MDLPTLAVMVFGGIALVVLVTHLTGGSVRIRLTSDDHVRDLWALDDPTPVTEVQRTGDDASALLALADGAHGVIFALGDRWVCRRLPTGAVRRIRQRDHTLILTLADFAAPSIRLLLPNESERVRWLERLEP